MRLKFALLCDYADLFMGKHLTIVGVGDGWQVAPDSPPRQPVNIQPHSLVVRLGASVGEIGPHTMRLRLLDDDGQDVFGVNLNFMIGEPAGMVPGIELTHTNCARLENLALPGHGGYVWEIVVDEQRLGELPFHVIPAPAPPPQEEAKQPIPGVE